MSCCSPSDLERLAAALEQGLTRELHLTPKPGLVDRLDSGSHPDLTFAVMKRSIALVRGGLDRIAASVRAGEPLERQVAIGRESEAGMLLELRANTHKGAIFLGGLLLAARGRAGCAEAELRPAVGSVARELMATRGPLSTHGEAARRRFGVGGILQEALAGLPSIFETALPAFRSGRRRGGDLSSASFAALARLMQTVEDTTALHRCGRDGLERIREDGLRLEQLLDQGGDHLAFLRERNVLYRSMNLTMGGVADLLGMALGLLVYWGEIPAPGTICGPPGGDPAIG